MIGRASTLALVGSKAGVGATAAALLFLLSACAARSAAPPAPPPAPPPAATDRLTTALDAIFGDARFAHALWAVDVRSLRTGETLYTRDAARLMIPASNQKLLTTAVAAERLGWSYRFTTRLLATGPIDSRGTLDGDLVVVGDGDPSINPRDPARWRVFDDWAAALADRGLRIVSGHLIGDDNLIAEPGWGDGWSWDDLQYGYGAAFGALQFNENQVEVSIGPGMTSGAKAIVATAPLGSGLLVENGVVTAAAGAETRLTLRRIPGTVFLSVAGQIAVDAAPVRQLAAVDNPTAFYLAALREALGRHGIVVGGREIDVDELPAPPSLAAATELLVDRSPPLADLVDVTLKWSRNEYAETLLVALSPEKPASSAQGLTVLRATLRDWGIEEGDILARDGSGLSRYDYLTARSLTSLLTRVWQSPGREAYRSSLPLAGENGNLADRLKGTAAAGRVWAKTGTLSNVRSLSGYVLTRDDEPLVFSIIANHFRTPTAEVDDATDRAVTRLADFARQ